MTANRFANVPQNAAQCKRESAGHSHKSKPDLAKRLAIKAKWPPSKTLPERQACRLRRSRRS
ncbi:hypothetical protein MESS4_750199 [Mesorhizobium sp. STM 4661]|nr:hypothetical protein MESS4_750199 [Mesorhizobium sp. STM 4661]